MADRINRIDLKRNIANHRQEYLEAFEKVLDDAAFSGGAYADRFEQEFARYCGVKACSGVNNGTSALHCAMAALGIGPGDEVIVQGNTYIASVMGITMNGATPIFVEPDEYFNIDASLIEEKITDKTKAILVVHLYGQASNMEPIMKLAHKYDLRVVEDCAQSHGARFRGKVTGTFGDIGCFSFYPSKNLGAFGDGGAIVTDDSEIEEAVRVFRNYGSEKRYYNRVVGTNSRLDEIQAGMLRVRLSHMQELENEKRRICERYLREIKNERITLPAIRPEATHIWHQFVIRCDTRDELINYLNEKNIGTIIHYPIPPHLSEAYHYLGMRKGELPVTEKYAEAVLSIPLYVGMTEEEQTYVIECLNAYEGRQ